jgi:uncharacterized protein (UPF0147 family)
MGTTELSQTTANVVKSVSEPTLADRISRVVWEANNLQNDWEDLLRALSKIVEDENTPDDIRDAAEVIHSDLEGTCLDVFTDQIEELETLIDDQD